MGAKTITFLEENIRLNLHGLELSIGFLDVTPKSQKDKIQLLRLQGNHQEKEKTIHRMGEIFANHIAVKGLTSECIKNYTTL